MPPLDIPLQLSPVLKPKIWGRKDLRPLYSRVGPSGVRTPPGPRATLQDSGRSELIGEVWLTDDAAKFLNGPPAGLTLAEASRKYGPELHGSAWRDNRFPILAKYIFTSDWLSVQVHPDDAYARVHDPGNLGKCEMWYIVGADRGAEILLGLKPGTRKHNLRALFEGGTSREHLNRFHPKAGEAVFVPPGTVHALGPALVLFEAEENSDLTYRLDDFGRVGLDGKPRPLHLEKGLDVVRAELPAYHHLPRIETREPYGLRRYVLACRYFAVEELTLRRLGTFTGHPERVEALAVLSGDGRVETAAGWLGTRTGDVWLIPPATRHYRVVPRVETHILKFYVPKFEGDAPWVLAKRGLRLSKIKQVVFGYDANAQ